MNFYPLPDDLKSKLISGRILKLGIFGLGIGSFFGYDGGKFAAEIIGVMWLAYGIMLWLAISLVQWLVMRIWYYLLKNAASNPRNFYWLGIEAGLVFGVEQKAAPNERVASDAGEKILLVRSRQRWQLFFLPDLLGFSIGFIPLLFNQSPATGYWVLGGITLIHLGLHFWDGFSIPEDGQAFLSVEPDGIRFPGREDAFLSYGEMESITILAKPPANPLFGRGPLLRVRRAGQSPTDLSLRYMDFEPDLLERYLERNAGSKFLP